MTAIEDSRLVYQVVAARRTHYHGLLWQVPVLSLTAQAFLFTIAMSGETSRLARATSSLLALTTTLVSMHLMARHRQAEVSDAHWLADYERTHFGDVMTVHGPAFKERRDVHSAGGPLARVPFAFVAWMVALGLFGLASLVVLAASIWSPGLLE